MTVAGWHEALVVVPNLAPWIDTLSAVGGRAIVHRDAANDTLNRLCKLSAGTVVEQVLMRNRMILSAASA